MSIIYSRTQDGTINVILSGKVTRDAEIKQTGNVSRVKFSVCYGKKQYMDCEAFADSDVGAIAGCLEKGDTVGVMGVYRKWEYNEKQYSCVTSDMIFTLAAPIATQDQGSDAPGNPDSFRSEIDSAQGELPF